MPVLARTRQQTRAMASTSAQSQPQAYRINYQENTKEKSKIDVNLIKSSSRIHPWYWNTEDKSHQVCNFQIDLQKQDSSRQFRALSYNIYIYR